MTIMVHSAEEQHPHEPKEQEQEEQGAEDAEWEEAEVVAVKAIAISIPIHRRDRKTLAILGRLLDRFGHLRCLGDALCQAGAIDKEPASDDQRQEEQGCDHT